MTKDLVKITGLWKNKDKDGNVYLSGSLTPISKFLVLPNTYKESDSNAPDYFLFVGANEKKTDNRGGNL